MRKTFLSIFYLLLLFGTSCTHINKSIIPNPAPAVYFWRTVYRLDSAEISFLQKHAIKKMYVRFFDVEIKGNSPIPVGTLQFATPFPKDIKVIPVVYIENNCLEHPQELASKIVKRVFAMAEACGITIDELQIDCDWTGKTQRDYFELLTEIKKLCPNNPFLLSSTIRLHQLSLQAPPVDYGILMCYNTGNLRDYNTENSILSDKDVRPFLSSLRKYPLPLAAAYPVFSWKLLFESHQFRAILRTEDLSDSTLYRRISPNKYVVLRTHSVPSPDPNSFGMMVRSGNEVKVDCVGAKEILQIQSLLEKERPNIDKQVTIYSLNSIDINKLTHYEMDQIYRR